MTNTVTVPREVIEQALALVNDMSRFVGVMTLQDYAALDAVPRNLSDALAAAPKAEPAPASDELLEALEGIVHFSDGFEAYGKQTTLGRALAQWINEARSLIDKHKGPLS